MHHPVVDKEEFLPSVSPGSFSDSYVSFQQDSAFVTVYFPHTLHRLAAENGKHR